jgi:hypothetical protein
MHTETVGDMIAPFVCWSHNTRRCEETRQFDEWTIQDCKLFQVSGSKSPAKNNLLAMKSKIMTCMFHRDPPRICMALLKKKMQGEGTRIYSNRRAAPNGVKWHGEQA